MRTILDSGVRVGAGSDSAQISTLNPWNMIYYMVTGKNVAGKLVNAGQQITREEAIRLYTAPMAGSSRRRTSWARSKRASSAMSSS